MELQVFENSEFGEIRTTQDEKGKVLFCGSDIAKALGYSNTRKALLDHCKGVTKRDTLTNGGGQTLSFIPESDVYRLIIKSKLPSAERFEKWVFEVVLPSIREHGGYITWDKMQDIFTNPSHLSDFLKQMLKVTEENEELKSQLVEFAPKVDYFDQLMEVGLLINFRTTAKEIGVRPLYLIHYLLENKYIFRNTKRELLPYQKHVEDGLFEIVEFCRNGHAGSQTLITPTGRKLFLQLYLDGEMEKGANK